MSSEYQDETSKESKTRHPGIGEIAHPAPIRAIAISGRSGCGNTTVNQLLSAELADSGFRGINYTMRSYAQELGLSLEEVARQAQQDPMLDQLIDCKQVEMARQQSCILSSRLAIWLLPQATVKVYLYASPDARSKRIHQREGGNLQQQLAETMARDQRDAERYRKLYGIDSNNFFFADLIINTETFDQHQVANMIIQAYQLRTA